jgi:hypothetical protein
MTKKYLHQKKVEKNSIFIKKHINISRIVKINLLKNYINE